MIDQPRSTDAIAPQRLHGLAFAVWAVAVAVGVLIHEWQRAQPPLSTTGLTVVLAVGVLLRPWSVLRVMALLASMALELVADLPNVFNHTLVIGVVGVTLLLWWLIALSRSTDRARDPRYVFASIAPFLRAAFVIVLFSAAISKLNTGFFDASTTCAVWILDAIPFVSIPGGLAGLMIVGGVIVEFAIPTLLLFRRTRFLAILVGMGFGVVTAFAGHAPFAGFGWSFYLLFMTPGTLGRAVVTLRRALPGRVQHWLTTTSTSPAGWLVLGAVALIVMGVVQLLPTELYGFVKRYGASVAFCLWTLAWAVLLLRNWRHWFRPPPASWGRFGAGHAVFAVAILLIVFNAASPYLGLKTRFSFTMFSNLQTEPGRWNHVVLPEAMRVFGLQDGIVRFDEVSDPALAAQLELYTGPKRTGSGAVTGDALGVPLLAAQRLASYFPDATITYEFDGTTYIAAPVSSDPILGVSVPYLVQKLGGFRPLDALDTCQL
jgi:Vitamin K-dependent gamma-carboxylase